MTPADPNIELPELRARLQRRYPALFVHYARIVGPYEHGRVRSQVVSYCANSLEDLQACGLLTTAMIEWRDRYFTPGVDARRAGRQPRPPAGDDFTLWNRERSGVRPFWELCIYTELEVDQREKCDTIALRRVAKRLLKGIAHPSGARS